MRKTKKQWAMFLSGLIAVLIGVSILGFFGVRKCYRLYQKKILLDNNPVVEIADLDIKAPILEGTDNETLSKATGHFKDSGDFGEGNYCIAGHSSTLYKEYFNNLKNVEIGYTLPKAWTSKAGIQSVRIYAQGQNLLTFDRLGDVDMDPEIKNGDGSWFPVQRVVNLGINMTF